MVRGSYTPPNRSTALAEGIQGTDPEGDSGLTISDGEVGIQTDGDEQLTATTDGVTMRVPVRDVTFAESPVSVDLDDFFVLIDTSAGVVEIILPSAVTSARRRYIIKDKGSASSNAVTVSAVSGNVDGFAQITLSNSFSSLSFVSDGTDFWAF